ncbi:antitoxin [Acidobacteria bacterium AH-259-L09]|nr:antitoxin [Acidobacteria bacterium AH-259-L09]
MSAISVRGIDEETRKRLKTAAERLGVSVNALILQYIRQVLGLGETNLGRPRYHDLDHLAGTWSAREAESFLKNIEQFEQVDQDLWR